MKKHITIEVQEDVDITRMPTTRFMTPDEYTNLIVNRAEMISRSNQPHPYVEEGYFDPVDIAERELLESPESFPLIIARHPRGKPDEYCLVEDMIPRDY